MTTLGQIIRKAAEPWMIEHGISDSHAEDLYARIQDGINRERERGAGLDFLKSDG